MARSVAYVSPSVTTFTNHNPAFRVYTLDSSTNKVIDYEQRYVPIQEGKELKPAELTLVWFGLIHYSAFSAAKAM